MFSNIKNLSKKLKIYHILTFVYFIFLYHINNNLSSIYCHLSISKFGIANENLK